MVRAERNKPGKTKKGAADAVATPSPEKAATGKETHKEHRLRILVIDDDHIDRMTVCRALEKSKLETEVEEVDNLREALAKVTRNTFDTLILDHLLPDGKSLDFLRDLRSRGIRLPIVVTTGYGDEMLVVDLLKTGACDYLSKDKINEDTIFKAVSHAIRVFKTEEERIRKDNLLEAGAEAATLLQTQMDRVTVISSALGILGKALEADRLVVYEQHPHPETKASVVSHEYEWVRTSDSIKLKDPDQSNLQFDELGISRWIAILSNGHPVGGPLRSFPENERQHLEAQGIRSLLAVPIMLDGRMWGFIQIEAHDKERLWTDQEKAILLSLSTGIGSALLHRRSDEALRRSEAFYRAIVDQQAELICRFTPDGQLTFVNETFSTYFGKTRDELVGSDLMALVEPDSCEDLRQHLKGLGPKTPSGTLEHCVLKPSGELRWMQCTCLAIFDGHDNVIEFQSVGRDITALKKNETALETSRDYLNKIINSIADPIFVKDSAHRQVLVNEAFSKLTGYPREDVVGKTDYDFFPSEQVDVFWKMDDEVLRTGIENINEEAITDADGVVHTIITKKTRYEDTSGENYIVGIIRDISELKEAEDALRESEEKYRTLVMNLDVGVSRTTADRNGRFLQANPSHARILGYDTVEELMNCRVADLYESPEERTQTIADLKDGALIRNHEVQFKKRDGSTIIASLTARAKVDGHGNIEWIDSVIEDITDRKRTE